MVGFLVVMELLSKTRILDNSDLLLILSLVKVIHALSFSDTTHCFLQALLINSIF